MKRKNKYYLGCDIGSTTVKVAALDQKANLMKSSYVKNKGIIESIQRSFEELGLEKNAQIAGLGITGSGRYFGNVLLKADLVKTEILAHAKAALYFYPQVKTIFEIGGEDCKMIIIDKGRIKDFQMNTICGGGTGAMIESIANRMGIPIEKVGEIALKSKNEISIAGKCGIFAQSTVVSKLNLGVNKEDILMGVCRALINNYFAMLAKGKVLEPPFVFQGATALNQALISCFAKEVSSEIIIPDYPHLMGAIGMALYLIENKPKETKFLGLENINNNFRTTNIKSNRCPNQCEVTYLFEGEKFIGSFGNRCEGCSKP
ncbi:MAG: acyl-CoA dehydratase activase [Patescibacteria group bacterium]